MTTRVQVTESRYYRYGVKGCIGTVIEEMHIGKDAHIIKVQLDHLEFALWFRPFELAPLEDEE